MPTVRGRNEGSLFLRRRDSRWVAMVTMTDGRRRSASAGSKTEGVALLRELLRQRDEQVAEDPTRLRVGPYLRRWIAEMTGLAPETMRKHEMIVRKHLAPKLGHRLLVELQPSHVDAYLERTDLDPQTRRHHRATLRRILADAVRDNLVPRNVAALSRPPRLNRKDRHVLTADEVRVLIDGTRGERLHAYWTLAATTGLRQAEMLGLAWSDIDGAMLTVRHTLQWVRGESVWAEPKTPKSRREVPIPPVALAALREHRRVQLEERAAAGSLGSDSLVFTTVRGKPIQGTNLIPPFRKALVRLGLPQVTIHSLRHSAATVLIANGYPIAKVARILGHSSSRVTEMVYSHLMGKDVRDAADVMERLYGEPGN